MHLADHQNNKMSDLYDKYTESTNLETYILTTSPGFISRSGSLFNGEKWQMQLLTDMHIGNAIPAKSIKEQVVTFRMINERKMNFSFYDILVISKHKNIKTRNSAIADKPRDAFRGQSRSNMPPFRMLCMVSYYAIVTLSVRRTIFFRNLTSKML